MSAIVIFILRIISALSLYFFLGFVIYILWKDLFSQKGDHEFSSGANIRINNIETQETFDFKIPEIFIGRSALAQIRLEEDEAVSNLHARIFLKGNNWWVEDLQSTNGTMVNRDPIVVPIILINGDQVSCGKTTIEVILNDESLVSEI